MNTIETTSMTSTLTTDTVRPMDAWFTALRGDTQADITEMVNEQGYPLDDIRDFVEQYGEEAYVAGHYVTWCELTEQTGAYNEAIEAYVDEVGIDNIGGFEDAYYGEFDSEAEFAEEYYINIMGCQDMAHATPALRAVERGIVVDWQATWDTNLQHDFAYNNGYVFNTNV